MKVATSKPEDRIRALLETLRSIDLDINWLIAVACLIAQEMAIKIKLEELGESYGEEDFQKLAEKLERALEERGKSVPSILISIVRAYRHIRGKIVHVPHKTKISEHEAIALLNNTTALIKELFEEKVIDVSAFVNSINESSLDEKVNEFIALKPETKKKIVMAIMDKIHTLDWREAPTYSVLCDFLKMAVKQEDDAKLQCELLAIIIEKTCGYRLYGEIKLKLLSIIAELTRLEHVKNFVKEKNLIKLLMAEFKLSDSYKEAAENAQIMLNLESCLTPEQINWIAIVALSNDQILYSYDAQDALRVLFSRHYDKIDKEAIKDKLAELERKDPKIARLWAQIAMGTW